MVELVPGLWQFKELRPTVNAYLWRGASGSTLIDTGCPGDGRRLLSAMAETGIDPKEIRRIVITHGDFDHAGGLGELLHRLRIPVYCHPLEQDLLRRPKSREFNHTWLRRFVDPLLHVLMQFGRHPLIGVEPTHLVDEGDQVADEFEVIHTPGHTPGHIALWHRGSKVLFSGDACLVRRGRIWEPAGIFTPDLPGARLSILKLANRVSSELETLASGHSSPVCSGAGRLLRTYAQELYL